MKTLGSGTVMGAMGMWYKLPGCLRSPCPAVCLSLACLASVWCSAPQGVSRYRLLEIVLGVGCDCDMWPKA